jgi:hypothetical protein
MGRGNRGTMLRYLLALLARMERAAGPAWLLDKDLRQRVTTGFEQVVHRIGGLSC